MPAVTVQKSFQLAVRYHQAGRLGEAEALYRQILAVQPDHADALHFLGVIAHQIGHHDVAVERIRQALVVAPNDAAAHSNLGEAYRAMGRFDEAIASYRRGLALEPDRPEIHNNLGLALAEQDKLDEAVAAHRRALALKPDYPEAHLNLGTALVRRNRLDEAVAAFRRALELRPDYPEAHNNLGNAHKSRGELDAAIAAYRRALQLKPEHCSAHSNLIYALHFHPDQKTAAIIEEQHRWNRQFSDPLKHLVLPHRHAPLPERRLRIGYVSPEFRDNVIGRYLVPLFACHDHRAFEIFCYSGVAKPDRETEKFRQRADQWRETVGIRDEAFAEMIRQDQVDILVDLSLHAAGNRLLVFARQPAPVQVSFASYPESTGLEAIGYRISDRYLESEREDRRSGEIGLELRPDLRRERVFLLESYWCYDPCGIEVPVNALPAEESGLVTFGCLNNFSKINEPLLRLWGRVLGKVRASRLVILTDEGSHRKRTLEILEREGVEAQRVEFVASRSRKAYLELYHRLDIALDPFPYNGHSTSLDALWMGVPVVSLAGDVPVSRAGWSQLANIGLAELVAFSEDDYVRIAAELAGDLARLAQLRATLRQRMQASRLMDAPGYARSIEASYRTMWREWCARQSLPPS